MVDNEPSTVEIKTPTRFVQVASIRSICQKWNRNDRIIIFRTERSNQVNWIDNPKNGEGLKTKLSNLLNSWESNDNHSLPSLNPGEDTNPEKYIVPNGFNQKELWDVFKIVYDTINEGDEIYFDMTHAFRTIPLFTTVLFNYSRFMKNSVVKEILYGAYEDLGTKFDLSNMEESAKENLEVQLVDLTEVVRLQDVNDAVSNFKQFGDMGSFIKILDKGRKEKKFNINFNPKRSPLDKSIFEIQESMRQLNFYTQTCNLNKLYKGEYIDSIYNKIGKIQDSEKIPGPQKELLFYIKKELSDSNFTNKASHQNIEAAINWLIKKNLIQQAVTLASEYIQETYYRLYDYLYSFPNGFKKSDSMSLILSSKKEKRKGSWSLYRNILNSILADRSFKEEDVMDYIQKRSVVAMQSPYDRLRQMRNKMNHADGVNSNSLDELRNNFSEIWENCLKILNAMSESNSEDISMSILWESQS